MYYRIIECSLQDRDEIINICNLWYVCCGIICGNEMLFSSSNNSLKTSFGLINFLYSSCLKAKITFSESLN